MAEWANEECDVCGVRPSLKLGNGWVRIWRDWSIHRCPICAKIPVAESAVILKYDTEAGGRDVVMALIPNLDKTKWNYRDKSEVL